MFQGTYSPVIPIGLGSGSIWRKVWVYVDSGSAYSIMQEEEAKRLEIEIEKGEKKYIKVGDGHTFPIYLHSLEVQIGKIRFNAKIGFSNDLKVGFNILGRLDIFNKFKICFDDKKNSLTFI